MKINFLYSGSRGDDTMTIMTVIVSSVSESLSDVCTAELPGEEVVGLMGTWQHLAYLHHTLYLHWHIYTINCSAISTLHQELLNFYFPWCLDNLQILELDLSPC